MHQAGRWEGAGRGERAPGPPAGLTRGTYGLNVMSAITISDNGAVLLLDAALVPRRWVRLYRNDVDVFRASHLGDFQPSAFPGYADREVTAEWSAVVLDPLGRAASLIAGLTWTHPGGGAPETCFGWVMYEKPAPDSLFVAGKRLTVPVPMAVIGNAVMISIAAYLLRG